MSYTINCCPAKKKNKVVVKKMGKLSTVFFNEQKPGIVIFMLDCIKSTFDLSFQTFSSFDLFPPSKSTVLGVCNQILAL